MPPRAFRTTSPYAKGIVSKATYGENPGAPYDSKAKREWHSRWSDTFQRTVKCAHCPDWPGVTGDGPTTREALAEHRLIHHYQENP